MKCLTYARVSTDKQADKQLSIPAQLSAMRQYAQSRGWVVLEEFVELGVSGRTVERPALRRLLSRCNDRERERVEVVLVHKLDRLARNLADHLAIRTMLRKADIALASVTESVDDSVSGQLVEHIMAAMSEFYSANLSEEVKKGMRQLVAKGGWPHRPPRGYRSTPEKHLVIDEKQAHVIKTAFDLAAISYRGIVELRLRMATLGLRTARGGPLSNGQMMNLLTNPFYCGRIRWNGQVHAGAHPPLIPPDLFDRVQGILQGRTRPVLRRSTAFLLSGIASCGRCGRLMSGEQHATHVYYRCRSSMQPGQSCKAPYVRADAVHRELSRILQSVAVSEDLRRRLCRGLQVIDATEGKDREGQRFGVCVQLEALRKRESYLTKAFHEGIISSDVFMDALRSVAGDQASLREQLEKLSRESKGVAWKQVLDRASTVWEVHACLPLAYQRAVIEAAFATLPLTKRGIGDFALRDSALPNAA